MSILKVAQMGHPVLRAKARAVDKSELKSPAVQHFIDSMIDTMHEYTGVGLAAPQVHESLRVFVAMLDADGDGEGDALVFINPEITVTGDQTVEGWEGCLSIPDIRGRVPRAQHIVVTRARSARQALRAGAEGFSGQGRAARERPSRRRAVLRSDEDAGVADLPRGVLALPRARRG